MSLPDQEAQADINETHWSVHPMKEEPRKALIFWPVTLITIWAVYWNTNSMLWTVLTILVLAISLPSYYLQSTYKIDSEGIHLRRWFYVRRFEWSRLKSIAVEKYGVFCSPFPVKSRLENYRGIYIPYRDNRDTVLSLIRTYAPNTVGLPGD